MRTLRCILSALLLSPTHSFSLADVGLVLLHLLCNGIYLTQENEVDTVTVHL